MANKKLTKIAALLLLGAFGLTACTNDIISKPSGYDTDPVITINDEENKDIYNNVSKIIFDAYREGTLASDVLDEVLYEYATAMFGRYNKVATKNALAEGEITLKEAAKAAKATFPTAEQKATINKFVKTHKAYWSVNADGDRVGDDNKKVADDADASNREIARVSKKWDTIEERIAETMYDRMNSEAFQTRKVFSEKKFLKSLCFDLKKVVSYDAATTTFQPETIINPDVEKKDVWNNFLTRKNYQPKAGLDEDETGNKETFIEDEIIPSIYRSLLTEQYILDKTYNTLGRTYARKINAIAISNNDNYNRAAPELMANLVNKINEKGSTITLDTFKEYAGVWKGVGIDDTNTIASALLSTKAFELGTSAATSEKYIKGTEYGELMEKFDKINDDPLLTDTSIESEFTSSNTYTKEIGKEIKTNEIKLNDYITTGWFTKDSGVEGLPSEITTRLFNSNVAKALDLDKETDRWQNDTYSEANDVNAYVAKINGKYYLKNESSEQSEKKNNILFYSRDSKTYYVVQIEEAVIGPKFSKTSASNYAALHDDETMEQYVNDVLKIVASSSTYETLSKKHWLNQMELQYHDSKVYDYFKSTFPELFED